MHGTYSELRNGSAAENSAEVSIETQDNIGIEASQTPLWNYKQIDLVRLTLISWVPHDTWKLWGINVKQPAVQPRVFYKAFRCSSIPK